MSGEAPSDAFVDALPGDGRQETANERYDRNWNELLQEFRVLQTGTQILAGFLLTLPFQQRFTELEPFDVGVYLVLVVIAVIVTLLALAPVSLHRLLFRRGAKEQLVKTSNTILMVCLGASSLLFTGIVLFIFDFLLSWPAGVIAGAAIFVLVLVLWIVVPVLLRRRGR
ncbi:DUF6328 family protein [Leifsonia sp. NPDC058230]|uniref:DUF6328 family protein n=1 Tax=Leifsonia sp. NPDC058230 TaxID=3346391 RepID=UPI0036DC15C1